MPNQFCGCPPTRQTYAAVAVPLPVLPRPRPQPSSPARADASGPVRRHVHRGAVPVPWLPRPRPRPLSVSARAGRCAEIESALRAAPRPHQAANAISSSRSHGLKAYSMAHTKAHPHARTHARTHACTHAHATIYARNYIGRWQLGRTLLGRPQLSLAY